MKWPALIFFAMITFATLAQTTPARDRIKVRKPVPVKCSASLLGLPGGSITRMQLGGVNNIQVYGDCDYTVVSFVLSTTMSGTLREFKSNGDAFDIEARIALLTLRPGGKFFIEKILMKSNVTGQVFSVPNLKFTVTQ